MPTAPVPRRYRFGEFVLSPRRRTLTRVDRVQPLIPRYFDLLVFLVERRGDAVHRRDIFDCVWTDVVVSDSALSQAIRTIRRVLDDNSREPRFVRTVSRHGYQFVGVDVIEEADDGDGPAPTTAASPRAESAPVDGAAQGPDDAFAPLLAQLARVATSASDEEEQREAAERLHALGTAETLRRLGTGRGHAFARALLRDTRWDVPVAGPVPILGAPGALAVAGHLVRLRLRRASTIAAARAGAAALGGSSAGALGGLAGGVLLVLAPDSAAPIAVAPVLALIGGACGAVGGAGVGAGLAVAESAMRSRRLAALVAGGAAGRHRRGPGQPVDARTPRCACSWAWTWPWAVASRASSSAPPPGFGYAVATGHATGGLAAPRGRERRRTALLTALACGVAALVLAAAGRPLVGGTVHAVAQASAGSPGRADAARPPRGRARLRSDLGGPHQSGRGRDVRSGPGLRPHAPPLNSAGADHQITRFRTDHPITQSPSHQITLGFSPSRTSHRLLTRC